MNEIEILRAQLKVLAEIDNRAEGEPDQFFRAWMDVRASLIRKFHRLIKEKKHAGSA